VSETLIPELLKGASVFALAFVSLWSAIVMGAALGLHPLATVALTSLSYLAGVALVIALGAPLRAWLLRRMGRDADAPLSGRMQAIWERYGVLGLGLAAPMTTGAHLGAALGIALRVEPRRLVLSMAFGVLVWSILLTAGVSLGLLGAQAALH
jgi:uncharacterized membrane protein